MSRAASLTCGVAVWAAILLSVLLSVADPAHAQQPDTTPPTVVNAATDETGQWITVTFSEPVVVSPFVALVQEHRRFFEISYFLRAVLDVTVDGHRDVLEIATNLSGNTLNISLTTPPIAAGQSVRLSYDNVFARNSALYVDTAGNALEFFSDMDVQNNSTVASAPSFAAGPVFSVEALTLDEGGSGTLTAKLASPPPGEVTVYLYMWPPNVGSVTGPGSPPPTDTASEPDWLLTFDETTWNTPQTLTATAGSDADSLDAWGLLHGFVGPPPTEYLRMNTSVHVLMEDQDPPLGIALATAPTVPLVEPYATRHFENDTTAIVDLTPIGHTTARWSLYLEDGNAFSISRDGVLSFRSPRDFEQPGGANGDNVYVVGILGQRGSSTGVVFAAITLANVPEPPTFPATATTRELPENPARFTDVGDPVAAVIDAGADNPTYTLTGTDSASFDIVSNTGQIQTKLGVTYDHETKSSYSVTVNVSDGVDSNGDADTSIDDSIAVTIIVTDVNELPAFPATEGGTRSVDENSNAGTNVGDPVSAIDEDGDALTYTLAGAEADSFEIVSTSGQIRTRSGVTYDHESKSEYSPTVNVSDGKDANGSADPAVDASIQVTVTVTDVNERPVVTGPVAENYPENASREVARYVATDHDDRDTISWSLAGRDRSLFTNNNGVLTFNAPPDYEARNPVYSVIVVATDDAGLMGQRGLTITVTDENEKPVFTSDVPVTVSHDENRSGVVATFAAHDPDPADTVIWSLAGGDAGAFTIVNGVLAFNSSRPAPDHETQNAYYVTVEASSGTDTISQTLSIIINDLDEEGTPILPPQAPQVGVGYVATFAEGDHVTSQSWTWHRSSSRGTWPDDAQPLATHQIYTPEADDVDSYLRVTVDYNDGHGEKTVQAVSERRVQAIERDNRSPTFPSDPIERTVSESSNARTPVGAPVRATDPDPNDTLGYSLTGSDLFTIDPVTGQIRVAANVVLDHEAQPAHSVFVTADDPSGGTANTTVKITVTNVNEPPTARDYPKKTTREDTPVTIKVLHGDTDPDDTPATLVVALANRPRNGSVTLDPNNAGALIYVPKANFSGTDTFTYRISDGQFSSNGTVTVAIQAVNDEPTFPMDGLERAVSSSAVAGTNVGAPVAAADVDGDPLVYELTDATRAFEIDQYTGQITVAGNVTLDAANLYTVTVAASDEMGGVASVDVTITVGEGPVIITPVFGGGVGGGGGGGGSSGPTPSDVDFEWNGTRDIEELAAGHDRTTGMWSDGVTLWLAHNDDGADDAIYAYDLESGERVEEREFELDDTNRAPRGVASDGVTMWIADSDRDTLFAHDLAGGERVAGQDVALHADNDDARGIWSDGVTMWVLDGGDEALFAYDLASGELLAEYALHDDNDDPHGLYFDGVTFWVSNHDPKRIFAYRLEAADGGELALVRNGDEEFTKLSRAGNNSARGIWSDGGVLYVADENDDRVYSYNMPDAIDARLASLTLGGVQFGEFLPRRTEYEGVADEGVTETTVEAVAVQSGAEVAIDPPDADEAADGHQLALGGVEAITVTVTSPDGSRERVYRVRFAEARWDPARDSWPHCLRGAVSEGFSLVVFEGGSVGELVACAESRGIVALYALHEGVYVSYILGAPEFVNGAFVELFADGLPVMTALTARSEGPPSADPFGDDLDDAGPQPWPQCLRGAVVEGFSLVVYEGGTVEELLTCAESREIVALYAVHDGEWVSYILGAPQFVNAPFRELFPGVVPAITPLVARSETP